MDPNPYAASEAASQREVGAVAKRTIKRFDPVQLGKILGVLYALMGVLLMPIFLIAAVMGDAKSGAVGVGVAVMIPIFYGVGGFIGGIILALIYNVCAKWVGGIQVEVE